MRGGQPRPAAPIKRPTAADIRAEWQRIQKNLGRSILTRLARWLLARLFSRTRLSAEDAGRIRDATGHGGVLYVARALSRLDFLCWRAALHASDLPVPLVANGLTSRASPELFARLLEAGRSVMFFLRRPPGAKSGASFQGPYEEQFLDVVRAGGTVVAVPLVLVWGTSGTRGSGARSWLESLVGAAHEPGPFRRFLQVLWRRRRAFLRAAEPLDLAAFLREVDAAPPEVQTRRLRFEVSGRIERERRVAFGPPLKSARRMRQEVLSSRRVAQAIEEAAGRYGHTGARRRAEAHVRAIAAEMRPWALRLWRLGLDALFARLYQGIDVDEVGLARARAAAGRGPLVFVPSHRSHIDYLALSYVVSHRGMFPPYIAAGANLNFFPVGPIFRRGGAFFVRRSPGGDRLYAAVFREYVRRLLRSGFSIEFFIEGGRSRTGKVLEPKLGLLGIIVDAVRDGDVAGLQIVPVSIGYERVLEEASYAAELAGAAKRPESVGAIIRATRVLASRHGRLDVQFDEPFGLTDVLAQHAAGADGGARTLLARVARRIVWGITRITAVTPTALVATALLAPGKRQLLRAELLAGATVLFHRVVATGNRVSPALTGDGGPNEAALDRALDMLEEDALVQIRGTRARPLYVIPEGSRQRLDYYRNHVRQALVGSTLVAMAALARSRRLGEPVPETELRERTLALSRLLEHEFVFEQDSTFEQVYARALADLTGNALLETSASGFCLRDVAAVELLAGLARDLVEGYWVAARGLDLLAHHDLAAREWVTRSCALGERLYLQRAISRPEGVVPATMHHALGYFRSRGVVTDEGGRLRAARPGVEVASEIESFLY